MKDKDNKINILTNDYYFTPFYSEVLCQLDEKLHFNRIYPIAYKDRNEFLQATLCEKVEYTFDYFAVYNARYDGCPFEDETTPLDSRILDEMSLYEPEALKMDERVNMAYDTGEKRFLGYHNHLRYWNAFLDKAEIDICFWFSKPHDVFDYIIYRLCKKKGICFVMQEILPFQSCFGCNYQTDYEKYDEKILRYKDILGTEISLSETMEKEYKLMTGAKDTVAPVIGESKKELRAHRISDYKSLASFDARQFGRKAVFHIREKTRVNHMIREYEKMAVVPDYSIPYIFFALHYQPEMTTSPTGGWFAHQYLAVEMLSHYAPEGVMIYVKEHPVIKIQHRTTTRLEHYLRMNKLDNVKLVKLDVSGEDLTRHAVAVAAISGSLGYWGMYNLKPYIMFGNLAMKYAPGTFNIRNNEDCITAMKALFEDEFSFSHEDVKKYISVLEAESVTFKYNPFTVDADDYDNKDVQAVVFKMVELIRAHGEKD